MVCHLDSFQFDTFSGFKLHLARLHFSAALRRDLASTLSAAGAEAATSASKKWRCDADSNADAGETCGVLLGGEPALMHHLAVQHDRVMAYLGADEKEKVMQGFGLGGHKEDTKNEKLKADEVIEKKNEEKKEETGEEIEKNEEEEGGV